MSDTTSQVIAETALQTAVALAPTLAAADPKVAAVVALAPVAIQFLQYGMQLQQAGVIPSDQLAALFASIGTGIQSAHSSWQQMNALDAARAA